MYRHRRRHRRHNPFSTSGIQAALMPAAWGAAGAVGMKIAYGYLSPSLPSTLTTGFMPTVVEAAAAIGLGMLVSRFKSRQDGMYVTVGGLTVVLVGAIVPMLQSAAPTLPGLSGLSGYGDYIPYNRNTMGAYMKRPGMGFYSPAPVLGAPGPKAMGRLGGMGAYMRQPVPGMMGLGDYSGGSGFNGLNDGM
jgi:hypothetical protein